MSIPYFLHIIGWNPFFVCKLHYFNTLITSNTAIHNYCESENGISERLKERKIFMKKHYTQHRRDLFFPLQKWLVSHSAVAERAYKTCIIAYTTWLSPEKVLGTSSLITWFHSYRSLSPGCMFGQRHDGFFNFFFLFSLCAVELDFYFPAAYIPWRKRKLIHEVPICIKCRNICHKILVGGLKNQDTVPPIICLNTMEFCFCQQEL